MSGSRSTPADGTTYDVVTRQTAVELLKAVDANAPDRELPFVFVSAHEAGWTELALGRQLEEAAPEWLGQYLAAKRAVETMLREEQSSVRPIVVRPSIMWNWAKVSALL